MATNMADELVKLINSNNYQSNLDSLKSGLKTVGYAKKTDEQLRNQAENLYKNQRDQAKLTAQQTYDETSAALANQLSQLGTSYDRQVEQQQEQTRQNLSAADRQAQSRGMGRSSYNNANLTNIQMKGDKALAQIEQERTNAESGIASQLTQLQKQLQQNLGAADSAYENSVISEIQRLSDQDYDREVTAANNANTLAMNLYTAANTAQQNQYNDILNLLKYNLDERSQDLDEYKEWGSGSSSSSRSSSSTYNKDNKNNGDGTDGQSPVPQAPNYGSDNLKDKLGSTGVKPLNFGSMSGPPFRTQTQIDSVAASKGLTRPTTTTTPTAAATRNTASLVDELNKKIASNKPA